MECRLESTLTQLWMAEICQWTGSLFPDCELSFPVPNLCNPNSGSITLTSFWYRISPSPTQNMVFIGVPNGRVTAPYPSPSRIRVGFSPWITIDRNILMDSMAQSPVQIEPFFDDHFFRSLPESGSLGIMVTRQNFLSPNHQLDQLFLLYEFCLQQYFFSSPLKINKLISFYQQFIRQIPPGLFLYYRRINLAFWDWLETSISSTLSNTKEEAVNAS